MVMTVGPLIFFCALGFHLPPPRYGTAVGIRLCAEPEPERTWWDKLRYGEKGKPLPPEEAAPPSPPSLEALFAQLDRDNSGALSTDELKHAFVILGLTDVDCDEAFASLAQCTSEECTFEEFDAALPPRIRERIFERCNDDGVLPSLYAPPEAWSEDRTAAELRWEAKVQQESIRGGNRLRQNDILRDELGKG